MWYRCMYLIFCSSVVQSHLEKDNKCGRVFSIKRICIKSVLLSTDHQLPHWVSNDLFNWEA